jgi:DNA-binding NtrC family response regulator
MTRKAWCPTCNVVDYVDARWRCLWCETVTLKRIGRRSGRRREARGVRAGLLLEAHQAHAEGATMREAAALIQTRAGYQDNRLLRGQLPDWWAGLNLPSRSLADAQTLRFKRNPQHLIRPDITTQDIQRALLTHGTKTAAARSLGVSRKTIRRRLAKIPA